ncbi:hypothetical protein TrLO_g5032 [Triparma laevis f. longispina]|uniref:Palmitoyltransferase n=1 Tax=Triparma laevis f. longispina TaxID=1714387 RepID=A0A9W6ZEK5_9STRA|nr:hypothetical protein TrLO_g5032 [Triparma laevis f. longispina]
MSSLTIPPGSVQVSNVSIDDIDNADDPSDDDQTWPRKDSNSNWLYASVKNSPNRPKPLPPPLNHFHNYCCCCASHYIGKMPVLLSSSTGHPLIVTGSWWPFCVFITFGLIFSIVGLLTIFLVVPYAPAWLTIPYYILVLITVLSLALTSCRNPGLIKKREKIDPEEPDGVNKDKWIFNDRCKSYRPRGALYCDQNDIIVEEFDHFCPWTGTSIGKNNMGTFKVFVVSVNFLCYATVGVAVYLLVAVRHAM